jgi:diguanylate cyclase (GGDEF)-like protein
MNGGRTVLDEKMLCAALDLVDVGMAIVGRDRRIEWCNAAYAEFLGRTPEELIGADFFGDARPHCEGFDLVDLWNGESVLTVSGECPGGPVDVSVRRVVPDSEQRLVVLRRGMVRAVRSRRLPAEVAEEVRGFVRELTGHVADPAILAASPLSILMIAIAEIEAIRLAHGEEGVEEVHRQVAQALVLEKRKADIIARYGDNQFLILAPETPHHGASMLAERIRRSVHALDLRAGDQPLTVTVLAHATEYRSQLGGSVRAAVEKASAALAAQTLQVVS